VVLKSLLSKANARYRAKVMLQDAIGSRGHKSGSEAVRKFFNVRHEYVLH